MSGIPACGYCAQFAFQFPIAAYPMFGQEIHGLGGLFQIVQFRPMGEAGALLCLDVILDIFASVIGAVLGYVCCIFVGAAKTDALQLVAVPVIAIIEAAVVSVAACLLATAIPLHSIAKMNIVETIENIE